MLSTKEKGLYWRIGVYCSLLLLIISVVLWYLIPALVDLRSSVTPAGAPQWATSRSFLTPCFAQNADGSLQDMGTNLKGFLPEGHFLVQVVSDYVPNDPPRHYYSQGVCTNVTVSVPMRFVDDKALRAALIEALNLSYAMYWEPLELTDDDIIVDPLLGE